MADLPTVQSTDSQTPIVSTCSMPSGQGTTGPSAGGAFSEIPDGEIIVQREPVYKSGNRTGYISEFVMFDGYRIAKEVASYLRPMVDAAAADGIRVKVNSGFRTMKDQERLKAEWTAKGRPKLAATPGYSKHQSGIAVDFDVHWNRKAYNWLVKNAYRYGFVRTVIRERWHWEYRGTWPGQQKPEWASSEQSMFSKVPRYHTCGGTSGGSSKMPDRLWWTRYYPNLSHLDKTTNGATNSWVGYGNEHLPDKFDREDPGWDKRGSSV